MAATRRRAGDGVVAELHDLGSARVAANVLQVPHETTIIEVAESLSLAVQDKAAFVGEEDNLIAGLDHVPAAVARLLDDLVEHA